MPERQIYLLDPKKLSAETIAVTFAKTSRSPQSFQQIASELTEEKSADFNEKWVVGYGHASVAEHAVLHIAVENISRMAVECLESNRLASYTEKSTRYQKWNADAFFTPPELDPFPDLKQDYIEAFHTLFETYHKCLSVVNDLVVSESPKQPAETQSAWERRIHVQVIDVCRFLLPAAALANVGVTINARALEHALCKMLSHPLAEVRSIGSEIKQTAQSNLPTLVKYATDRPYLIDTPLTLERDAAAITPHAPADWCQLVSYDADGENSILAAALYRYSGHSYAQCLNWIHQASAADRARVASHLVDKLDRHDIPLREFEYADLTFDVYLDQGAYFELKRHRMMTQTAQAFTPYLGYAIPRRITTAGLGADYQSAMQTARSVYEKIAVFNPHVAAYILPNAYNRRVLLKTNLRSALHFITLRSAPNAHFSIRRVAQRMAGQIASVSSLFSLVFKPQTEETWQGIEDEHFTSTAR